MSDINTINTNGTDVLIIGAGAAGLMCAIEAGKRGRRVVLIDHAKKMGEKIRISGGGRCNFTNIHTSPENYISANPHFCKSALARYRPQDFIKLVEAYGIPYFEKTLGQLFCETSAKDIIQMLRSECDKAGVKIQLDTTVISIEKKADGFLVKTNNQLFLAQSLVVACGGKSIPKMGATGFGYDVAKQFGVNVLETRPGLVPLTMDQAGREKYGTLAGVSVAAAVRCGKTTFREALLFTHRGISGPAILQISSHWSEGQSITINLAPEHDFEALLHSAKQVGSKRGLVGFLSQYLPARLAQFWVSDTGAPTERPIAELSNQSLSEMARAINGWQFTPQGSEGYRTAEVTIGGVDTGALSSKTFEVSSTPGLYFIGEVLDVTGHLGGYNFQWAWASGFAAGQFV